MLEQMRPSELGMWFELYALDSKTNKLVARMRPDPVADNAALSSQILSSLRPWMRRDDKTKKRG